MSISLNTLELSGMQLQALLKTLEENFAWRTPTYTDDIAKVMYHAGQASVLEYIKKYLEEN